MKATALIATVIALTAAPLLAQDTGRAAAIPDHGYVSGFGGVTTASGNSTGSVLFEGGVHLAPRLMAFGTLGRFANLQSDLQPTLDATTTALASDGVGVSSTGTLPAWYGLGGLRAEVAASKHALPYVLGGIGAARLNPTTHFTFASGTLPDGSTPDTGTDVTSAVVTADAVTLPAASSAFMLMLGGGVQVPIVRHWAADVGYRYSRIAADSTLSASPLNTNMMTFGFGYRF